jgi:hypothetical protein
VGRSLSGSSVKTCVCMAAAIAWGVVWVVRACKMQSWETKDGMGVNQEFVNGIGVAFEGLHT